MTDTNQNDGDTFVITGNTWMNKAMFDRDYRPEIVAAVAKGGRFIVGNAIGCDAFAQDLLHELGVEVTRVDIYDVDNAQKGPAELAHCAARPDYGFGRSVFAKFKARDIAMGRRADTLIVTHYVVGGATCGSLLVHIAGVLNKAGVTEDVARRLFDSIREGSERTPIFDQLAALVRDQAELAVKQEK